LEQEGDEIGERDPKSVVINAIERIASFRRSK